MERNSKKVVDRKKCHLCSKVLSRPYERSFLHCFECGLKRLEELTSCYEPCPICKKEKVMQK